MKPSTTSFSVGSIVLAMCALALALAGCGGGGGQTGGTDSFVADVPQDPAIPPGSDAPAPGPAPAPAPDVPAEPDEGDAVPPEEVPEVPPEEQDRPVDVRQPEPPVPLASWEAFPNIRALAMDSAEGVLYAVSSNEGDQDGVYRLAKAGGAEPELVALLDLHRIVGLAFDSDARVLYAVQDLPGEDDHLLRLDPAEFGPTPDHYLPGDLGAIVGHAGIESLTYDPEKKRLLAVDVDSDVLLAIDPGDAQATVIGDLGAYGRVVGLTLDAEKKLLLGTDAEARALVAIDLDTGAATLRARLDRSIEALASDVGSFLLYGASLDPAEVFAFDALGERWPFGGIKGLAFDPADNLLFGVHAETGVIVKIDRALDQRTYVGFVRKPALEGLALDNSTRTLYAVSRSNQQVYALSPEDASIQDELNVHGAAAPFLGLSALTIVNDILYASDSATGNLLAIDKATGNAVVLGAPNGYPKIEGLAFDADTQVLHAFCNDQRAHLILSPKDPNTAVMISKGEIAAIGGLAYAMHERVPLGTDLVADALVEVALPREPQTLGFEQLSAMAFQPDPDRLVAFDRATRTLLSVDPDLRLGIPIATLEGIAIEGMTHDRVGDRLFAVDAQAGTLYTLSRGGEAVRVGDAGALAAHNVKAIAFDAVNGVLYGIDVDQDVLLIIDPAGTGVQVVDPSGDGLAHGSIESLVYDEVRATLLGIDRETRSLVAIDVNEGTSSAIAQLDAEQVGGLAMLPGSLVLWVANGDEVLTVDRFDGGLVDPGPGLALLGDDAVPAEAPVKLLWPQGDVSRDALASCAVEVGASHSGALDLELRCGDRVLHQSQLTPDGALARFEIPDPVRSALESGASITWRVGDVTAAFRVVDGHPARATVEGILAHPTVAGRSDWERRLVEAFLLDQAGLHTEALVVGIGTYETYPDRPTSARSLLRTLKYLGLVETRLGREVYLRAMTP